jgi:hypothetical protein
MRLRRFAPVALALLVVLPGCAGPSKLAERGEEKLASGENGRAWDLAVRALKKDPGNARAREVAEEAGNAMARNREQRIAALAASDSLAAADQVLELAAFRLDASPYAAITVSPTQSHAELALRTAAARSHYQHGVADLAAKRPKRAYLALQSAQRYVEDFRDAAKLADKAMERAVTRVVVVPFASSSGNVELGRDVAASWRDDLARRIAPPDAHFTRVLGSPQAEEQMTVAQLDRVSRGDAIDIGRKAGAQRVVWGTIGHMDSHTGLQLYTEAIARRIVEKHPDGSSTTHWVDVPVEVVARVRTVNVDVDYEVIATRDGSTLAHQGAKRTSTARVVWTSFDPEGDLDDYALVSDVVRAASPERAKAAEAHWHEVCGDNTTLRQVLEARRSSRSSGQYQRENVLPRLVAGAAFVFLQELPPTEDLAFAALAPGWQPLQRDLLRLDDVDDVDLGMAAGGDAR